MIKDNCHHCIDSYVSRLPKYKDYAEDGSIYEIPPITDYSKTQINPVDNTNIYKTPGMSYEQLKEQGLDKDRYAAQLRYEKQQKALEIEKSRKNNTMLSGVKLTPEIEKEHAKRVAEYQVTQEHKPFVKKATDFGIDLALNFIPDIAAVKYVGSATNTAKALKKIDKISKIFPKNIVEKGLTRREIYRGSSQNVEEAKKELLYWIEHPETIKRMKNLPIEKDEYGIPKSIFKTQSNTGESYEKTLYNNLMKTMEDKSAREFFFKYGLTPEQKKRIADIRLVIKQSKGGKTKIDNDVIRNYIKTQQMSGVSFQNGPSYVMATKPGSSRIPIQQNPSKVKDIAIHEGTHTWQNVFPFTSSEEKLLKSIIKDPPLNILGKVSKKHSEYDSFGWKYFTNPNEIHARMMEVRIYLNKKPGDIVTIDELNSILPSDSNNAFNKMFKYVNKDDFIDVMNKIRGVAIPIGLTGAITTGLNKNNKE